MNYHFDLVQEILYFYDWTGFEKFVRSNFIYKYFIFSICYAICIIFTLLEELNEITSLSGYFFNL